VQQGGEYIFRMYVKEEKTLHVACKAHFSTVSSIVQHFAGTTVAAALVVLPTNEQRPVLAHSNKVSDISSNIPLLF
jgi:hypothetical protein